MRKNKYHRSKTEKNECLFGSYFFIHARVCESLLVNFSHKVAHKKLYNRNSSLKTFSSGRRRKWRFHMGPKPFLLCFCFPCGLERKETQESWNPMAFMLSKNADFSDIFSKASQHQLYGQELVVSRPISVMDSEIMRMCFTSNRRFRGWCWVRHPYGE